MRSPVRCEPASDTRRPGTVRSDGLLGFSSARRTSGAIVAADLGEPANRGGDRGEPARDWRPARRATATATCPPRLGIMLPVRRAIAAVMAVGKGAPGCEPSARSWAATRAGPGGRLGDRQPAAGMAAT